MELLLFLVRLANNCLTLELAWRISSSSKMFLSTQRSSFGCRWKTRDDSLRRTNSRLASNIPVKLTVHLLVSQGTGKSRRSLKRYFPSTDQSLEIIPRSQSAKEKRESDGMRDDIFQLLGDLRQRSDFTRAGALFVGDHDGSRFFVVSKSEILQLRICSKRHKAWFLYLTLYHPNHQR